jgi:3-hydroxybutyryl-CoA dehydrogenase
MVTAGLRGRKSGRGFYTYEEGSARVVPDALTREVDTAPGRLRPVRSVGVVGSGTSATAVAESFALAGYDVTHVARSQTRPEAVAEALARSLDKAVHRGTVSDEDRIAALARVRGTASLAELAEADLVVEAEAEDLTVKRVLFEELDGICRPGAILATTTSSVPVIECAAATGRPQDVVGIHFVNLGTMSLVEVVHTVTTAQDVVDTARDLCRQLGKHPVTCGDRAGFIVNALLFPYLNDAVRMLETHYAGADDIDTAMKAGCGYPMGPFELLDEVGLDVALAAQRQLYLQFREQGLSPAPLLEQLVTAGYLGRTTGRGFRTYA